MAFFPIFGAALRARAKNRKKCLKKIWRTIPAEIPPFGGNVRPGKKSLDFENQFTTLSRQFTTFSRQFTTFFAPIFPSTYTGARSAPPYF